MNQYLVNLAIFYLQTYDVKNSHMVQEFQKKSFVTSENIILEIFAQPK